MAPIATAPPAGKRPASGEEEGHRLLVTPLGAGSEIGRCCVHMTFKGRTVVTEFKGCVFMTPATKAMYKLQLMDQFRILGSRTSCSTSRTSPIQWRKSRS